LYQLVFGISYLLELSFGLIFRLNESFIGFQLMVSVQVPVGFA
jgi:hypothetical protein